MPPATTQRATARRRRLFGLLAVFGLVVASQPLVEAWRHQGLELREAADARRALVASTQAVQTQRALAAHRPYAAAVLAGRTEQEPERLRHQLAVDADVGTLVGLLEAQQLHRALDETDQLRADWTRLLMSIGRGQMSPATSNAAHDLLAEQTFVIMDLIGSEGRLTGQVGRAVDEDAWMLARRTLPRLAMALAAEAADDVGPDGARQRADPLHPHARRAAKGAAAVLHAAYARAGDPREPAPAPALARALSAVQQHAAALLQTENATAAARAAARQRVLAASIEAQAALAARIDADIAAFAAGRRTERLLVAAAGAVLMLLGMLAAAMARPRSAADEADEAESADDMESARDADDAVVERPPATADADDDVDTAARPFASSPGRPESRDPAEALMERLRRRRRGSPAGVDPAAAADPPAGA